MIRNIKHLSKAFREYNIRKRGLGYPEVTLEEYKLLQDKVSLDCNGKLHPKIQYAETKMIKIFGNEIKIKHKICIHCLRLKFLIDFICRYKTKRIENICKECERKRKREMYKNGKRNINR